MKRFFEFGTIVFFLLWASSCDKQEDPIDDLNNPSSAKLNLSLEFDESLPRLGNFGQTVNIQEGHAAQNPQMKEVSLHYVEFAPGPLTLLGNGAVVYKGAETTIGGESAVNFDQAAKGAEGETIISVDRSTLPPGTYTWLRVSLTYQNYDIDFRFNYPPFINNQDYKGNLASFVGFNTYITSHQVGENSIAVNSNKKQGYWAFDTNINFAGTNYGEVFKGDGAGVTVVNPINSTSPIPAGSCVVTGELAEPLVITGDETEDIEVVLAFSINNSFEWIEVNTDGKFEPAAGETVVDMGLRGLHPYVKD